MGTVRLGESDHKETRTLWSSPEYSARRVGRVCGDESEREVFGVADNAGFLLSVTEFATEIGVALSFYSI